jgi:hypothetical protein
MTWYSVKRRDNFTYTYLLVYNISFQNTVFLKLLFCVGVKLDLSLSHLKGRALSEEVWEQRAEGKFGSKTEVETWSCRTIHDEGFHNFTLHHILLGWINQGRWDGRDMQHAQNYMSKNLMGRDQLGKLGGYGKIMLKWILKKVCVCVCVYWIQSPKDLIQ